MNRLQTELHRLYDANMPHPVGDESASAGFELIDVDGKVRALVLEVAQPAGSDWITTLWKGIQDDLDLPAPAIAVSGSDGFQVWFSLSEPVPVEQALDFLESLRLHYLRDIASGNVGMKPAADASAPRQAVHTRLVPALQIETGRWSAFVSAGLASVFAEEPWLDMQPGFDAQANLLSSVKSIKPADFQRARNRLRLAGAPAVQNQGSASADATDGATERPNPLQASARTDSDPRCFLLSVMNDPAAELHLRIEAAKALLPLFEGVRGD